MTTIPALVHTAVADYYLMLRLTRLRLPQLRASLADNRAEYSRLSRMLRNAQQTQAAEDIGRYARMTARAFKNCQHLHNELAVGLMQRELLIVGLDPLEATNNEILGC